MKTLATLLSLGLALQLSAQNFSGKAIYKTNSKSGIKIDSKQMSDKQKEQIEARLRKMNQKTYHLEFNKNESTYKQEAQLNAPSGPSKSGGMMVMSFSGNDNAILYKNVAENRYSKKTELMGKVFLIKDDLEKQDWILTTETKTIGQYTCYKATLTKEVEDINISVINGETKEKITKRDQVTTAWYTPQIPVNNGPENYQGLPGLILEVNDGRTTMVCTEIVLNGEAEKSIEEPKKGKVVSQKKYDKISKEKTNELMEQFKSRKGATIGGKTIRISG